MDEPSVTLITFGLSTLAFLPIVLLFTLVGDYGYLGICWATFIHLFLRFVIAFGLVKRKKGFSRANESAKFFSRATV